MRALDDHMVSRFATATEAVQGGEVLATPASGPAVKSLFGSLRHLRLVAKASGTLSAEMGRIAVGRSRIEPDRGDSRFTDPTWDQSWFHRRIKQSYLAWSAAVFELAGTPRGDWRDRERASFGASLVTSALAPTNTLALNPEALKRAFETGGASLGRGLANMVHDVTHNGAMPSHIHDGMFRVGENVASTAGVVIYRDEQCELLRYEPFTPHVRSRPVLIVPPMINKYYFLDLGGGRSFVEYQVSRGFQVFLLSWRNPEATDGDWDLDAYATSILHATDAALSLTDQDTIDLFGFCAGGIVMAALLAHLAATGDHRVSTASFAVTLLDYDVPAQIGMMDTKGLLALSKYRSRRAGVLDGDALGRLFLWLRPNELVWNYVTNNWLLGNDPPTFDILAWNDDAVNLPGKLHGEFLDIFGENAFTKPGSLTILGTPVDLGSIELETYVTGATTDHLTPWKGCYRATQMMSGPSTFVLSSAGHIQSLVNPPGNPKAYYLVGPDPGPDPEAWHAAAQRRHGSWWEHWTDWIVERSAATRPAPQALGNRDYPILAHAPGAYVYG